MQDLAFPRAQVVLAAVAVLVLVLLGTPPSQPSVPATTMPTWSEREAAARWIATHRPDTVSFAALDASGQQVAAYRADTTVPAASTVKIMIVAAYLRQAAVAQSDLTAGERLQLYNVVAWSSNDDATRLLQQVGWPAMAELADDAGMDGGFVPDYDSWGLTEVTAASLAQLFHRLPSLLPQRHRDFALGLFQEVVPGHQWGMPAVTPGNWDWYVKGGWISSVVNQVGTFTSGANEFTVAVTVAGGPDTGSRVTLAPDDVPAVQTIEAVTRALFAGGSIPAGPVGACRSASAVPAGAAQSDGALVPACGWAAARRSTT
jgi:hypothetical protein